MKKNSNLTRLLSYAGNRRILTYLSWILAAASALIALLPFWYIWRILKEVIEVGADFSQAVNITHYGWLAVGYAVLAVLVYIGGLMCSHLAAFRIATNIRIEMVEHIATLPLGEIEKFGTGKLRRIVSETAGAAEAYLAHQLPDKYRAMATVAGLLVLLAAFDWRLGILSLLPVALGMVCMMGMTGKEMQVKMTEYQNALADMSNEAVEYVRGIPVVKTFGQTIFSFKKFKASIDRYEEWVIAYTNALRKPMMFYTAAINSVFVFLIIGAFWFTRAGVTAEFLLNLLFYIIITPVISLTLTKIMYMSEGKMIVQDAVERIDSVLNIAPLSEAAAPASPKNHAIKLENVSFSYDGTKDALKNVSFEIKDGETAAFVGPSGGGKSTMAAIVARFFDPKEGRVLIGGVDVRDMKKEELMNTVSFVFQNSHLLKGTILDNVRLGKPDAAEAEVMQALKDAQCMDIIEKFPSGLKTVIGSSGVYLSGGEAQRITIARAMLKNAPIIILDEATAFADPDNETKVQQAFNKLAEGRTVIMIAHRLSTVKDADRIFVLANGTVRESGKFAELKEKGGLFAKMWHDYQQSVEWKVVKEV